MFLAVSDWTTTDGVGTECLTIIGISTLSLLVDGGVSSEILVSEEALLTGSFEDMS